MVHEVLRQEMTKLFWELEQLCLSEIESERTYAIQAQKVLVEVARRLGVTL